MNPIENKSNAVTEGLFAKNFNNTPSMKGTQSSKERVNPDGVIKNYCLEKKLFNAVIKDASSHGLLKQGWLRDLVKDEEALVSAAWESSISLLVRDIVDIRTLKGLNISIQIPKGPFFDTKGLSLAQQLKKLYLFEKLTPPFMSSSNRFVIQENEKESSENFIRRMETVMKFRAEKRELIKNEIMFKEIIDLLADIDS